MKGHSRLVAHAYPRLYTNPRIGTGSRTRCRSATVRMTRIENNMAGNIFWRDSHGVAAIEMPVQSPIVKGTIQIVIEYQFDTRTRFDVNAAAQGFIDNGHRVDQRDLNKVLEQLENTPAHIRERNVYFTLEITAEQLKNCGGVVYVADVDLIIGWQSLMTESIHPNSLEGNIEQLRRDDTRLDTTSQSVMVIDNAKTWISSRYYNTGLCVQEIRSVVDHSRKDGVYVFATDIDGSEKATYLTLKEADGSGFFFASPEMALSQGSPSQVFQSQLEERKNELKQAQMHREESQQRIRDLESERKVTEERHRAELETERQKYKHEIEMEALREKRQSDRTRYEREQEVLRRKEELEENQHHRREDTERQRFRYESTRMLLQIGTLLAPAALAIGGWLVKRFVISRI